MPSPQSIIFLQISGKKIRHTYTTKLHLAIWWLFQLIFSKYFVRYWKRITINPDSCIAESTSEGRLSKEIFLHSQGSNSRPLVKDRGISTIPPQPILILESWIFFLRLSSLINFMSCSFIFVNLKKNVTVLYLIF